MSFGYASTINTLSYQATLFTDKFLELAAQVVDDDRLLALYDALAKFNVVNPRKAGLVRLRYFAGLTFEEAAEVMEIAVPTAKEWWAYARSWLLVQMRKETES